MEVPLPLFRCPGRRKARCSDIQNELFNLVTDDILGITGFELKREIQVKSYTLGCFKTIVILLAISGWLFVYGCWYNKSYLDVSPITGAVRLQVQHPTKDHCPPTHTGCEPDFRSLDDLPYCQSEGKDPSEVCRYADQFDLTLGMKGFGTGELMMPTRCSTYTQTKHSCKDKKECSSYTTVGEVEVRRMADIENFTVLVDHAFHADDLGMHGNAGEMQGFIRICPGRDGCLLALDNFPSFDEQILTQMQKKHERDDRGIFLHNGMNITERAKKTVRDLRHFWGVEKTIDQRNGFSLPNGDVLRVGYILKLLGINIDNKSQANFQGQTMRDEGFFVYVTVMYTNYKKMSMPNGLPAIYELEFTVADFQTYKTNSVSQLSSHERIVNDWHGMFLRSYQRGQLGRTSWRQILLMLIETSFLLGFCRWMTRFVALNWYIGEGGDILEDLAKEEYEFEAEATEKEATQKDKVIRRTKAAPEILLKEAAQEEAAQEEAAQESPRGGYEPLVRK